MLLPDVAALTGSTAAPPRSVPRPRRRSERGEKAAKAAEKAAKEERRKAEEKARREEEARLAREAEDREFERGGERVAAEDDARADARSVPRARAPWRSSLTPGTTRVDRTTRSLDAGPRDGVAFERG